MRYAILTLLDHNDQDNDLVDQQNYHHNQHDNDNQYNNHDNVVCADFMHSCPKFLPVLNSTGQPESASDKASFDHQDFGSHIVTINIIISVNSDITTLAVKSHKNITLQPHDVIP